MAWRGYVVPEAEERWPSRVESFLEACAIQAGNRERDIVDLMKALGQVMEKLG